MYRKIAWGLVLVLFIASIVFINQYEKGEASSASFLGKITVVSGAVYVKMPNQNPKPATQGLKLLPNQTVQTGSNGKAVIVMTNGAQLRLGSNSKVVMNLAIAASLNSSSSAGVMSGTVQVLATSGTRINTASSVAGVRGTEFLIGVAETGASNVMVLEGEVDVMGSKPAAQQSNTVNLRANQRAETSVVSAPAVGRIVESGNPSQLTVADAKEPMVDFKQEETEELENNPVQVLDNFTRKLENVEDTTDESIEEVKEITEVIQQANQSSSENIDKQDEQKIVELDTQIQADRNQNEAIAQLAETIVDDYDEPEVRQQAQEVQEAHQRVTEKQSELGKWVLKMEEEMDAFIAHHEEYFNQFWGEEDDDGFDLNEGFEDFQW